MRPSQPLPQARAPPQVCITPTIEGRKTQESFEPSPMMSLVNDKGGVKYVTIGIPVDMQPTTENMVKYFNPSNRATTSMSTPSPMTVCTAGTGSIASSRNFLRSAPVGFVPITSDDRRGVQSPFSPTASLYDYGTSPSPSVMSTMTTETFLSRGLDRMSPAFVPSVYRPPTPQDVQQQQSSSAKMDRTSPAFVPSTYRPSTPQDVWQKQSSRPKTPTGRKSPFVKNSHANSISSNNNGADDDSVRKSRLKTEMCMNYASNRPCPFGANCTYAHGEEELQMTKLLDLSKAGLIDVETYRTKPCLTWVATGSCPFGKRCTGIHDPRIDGSNPSWLPHTETQGNTMATDINVDSLHQKRLHTILYDNPFGDQFSFGNSWSDLYKLICCIDYSNKDGWIDKRRQRGLGPIYKLQIALKLRATPDWQYKYRPQHIVHNELCMVLQKRAFRIGNTMEAVEIPLSSYNIRLPSHVLVREIAFGPDSDPAVRGVSLWFNISEDEVQICTPQQAKRFRWKRTVKGSSSKDQESQTDTSVFQKLDSFPMIRPDDKYAFNLATDIMKHRLSVLQTERLSSMSDRFEALKKLEAQKKLLKERFENQKRSWVDWAWPVNVGRKKVDKRTPVPPVDVKYSLESPKANAMKAQIEGYDDMSEQDSNDDESGERLILGSAVYRVWESFLAANSSGSKSKERHGTESLGKCKRRLVVFEKLAMGEHFDADRTLPHIRRHAMPYDPVNQTISRQQEHCWKALLLSSEGSYEACNEWDLVREHFENSRSKKVLSIIQQKERV